MDEATAVAESELARLRSLGYKELVSRLIDRESETATVAGASGASYQVEVAGIWDAGGRASGGDIRVIVSVDGGGVRAFKPLTKDFIVSPDGSFVGE